MKRALILILFLISAANAGIGSDLHHKYKNELPSQQPIEPNSHRRPLLALQDGYMIDGIDGKVSKDGNSFYFSPIESLTDGKGSLSGGTQAQILPSSMLEKLSAEMPEKNKNYRLWGKFTNYQNTNFIYVSYFLPVAAVNEPTDEPEFFDPNEDKIIPDDVMALLVPKRVVSLDEISKPLATESDAVLYDRTGFLKKEGEDYYFNFDELGRKIDTLSLPLLKCQTLEDMIKEQKLAPVPLRLSISAIVTVYKGKNYLLLQRSERAYNHGNFAR